ncbi:type II secretion system F family protein [Micromonospora soli]|uniref:type II secretion system F family protein n=1 Tax=Micromonospora sp. NBRC 110009 TaxID=3061627 RepID=UPI002673A0AA|nr:type II secretion system F family protein [Micromonospora sp. NBRC 110009]WKU01108.1 type II secretion system F family protein [Micromonospora sp. NBRC 110009]
MVIRRVGLVVLAALAALLGTGVPALADRSLAVTVLDVTPGQVQLVADVFGAPAGQTPPVTVAQDGRLLPSSMQAADPADPPARAVVVVLDTGAAMAGPRLPAARDGVLAFAERLPADVAVGLVTAAEKPTVLLRPSRDRNALRTALSGVRASGETAIYGGLRTAAEAAKAVPDRRLLVVTAGRNTTGDPAPVVRDLSAVGDRVDLVSVQAPSTGLAELRQLVTATGGTVRPAERADAVGAALRATADTVPLRFTITVDVPAELAGTAGNLTVTVGTGAGITRTSVPVQFVSSAPSPAAADPLLSAAPLRRPQLIAVLVFGVLLVSTLLVLSGLTGSTRQRRLRQVEQFRMPTASGARTPGAPQARPRPRGGVAGTVLALSDRIAQTRGGDERIAQDLERAGITLRPREWIAARAGATLAGALLLGLLGGVLGALLGAALGWLAAGLYRRVREMRRRQAFADQLPDTLQLVVGSLRSGFSLAQAIDGVVQDAPPGPLTVELGRAMAEVRLGSDLDDALDRVAQRVENDDLAWAVMAIRIQRDTGGNLAEVLETTVETLRERDRLRRHVRALSAEGRLSAYVLIALPIVLGIWMLLTRRDYLSALWTTSIGLTMLIGALLLMVVGIFWMARWIKVEV